MSYRTFTDFCYDRVDVTHYDDFTIEVEVAQFNAFEQVVLGFEDGDASQHPQKYRITVSYPKTKRAWKATMSDTEVYYVAANDPKEAKKKVVQYLTNKKVKPDREMSDWVKKALREIRTQTKAVNKNWNDLVQMLYYIAERGFRNPLRFFDQNDLTVFLKKRMGSTDFGAVLQSLPKKEQILLKKFLSDALNKPSLSHQNIELLNTPGRYAKDKTQKELIGGNLSNYGLRGAERRQSKDYDKDTWVHEKSSVMDIIRDAKRYGFTKQDLDNEVEETSYYDSQKIEAEREAWEEASKAWRYTAEIIRKRATARGIPFRWNSKFVQEADADTYLEKIGGLDDVATEAGGMFPGTFHASNRYINGHGHMSYDIHQSTGEEEPIEYQMLELFRAGPPKEPKMPPRSQLYYNALKELIKRAKEGNYNPAPQTVPPKKNKQATQFTQDDMDKWHGHDPIDGPEQPPQAVAQPQPRPQYFKPPEQQQQPQHPAHRPKTPEEEEAEAAFQAFLRGERDTPF